MIRILNKLEEVVKAPDEIADLIARKEYVAAVKRNVKAIRDLYSEVRVGGVEMRLAF